MDEHGPIVKETIVLEGPILHFHNCGRKSNSQIAWSPPFICTTKVQLFVEKNHPAHDQ